MSNTPKSSRSDFNKLSKTEVVREIAKCRKDPTYFLYKYAKIQHPKYGTIPFKTYDFQDQLLKDFKEHRFNIILKARQLGISTITAGHVAWMMMFHKDKNVLTMATKRDTATEIVKKVKMIIKSTPPRMRGMIGEIEIDNKTSLELTNGSRIKATSTSPDAGRGEALSLLIVDEAAHVEGMDDLWTGLYSTLSTGGSCIALSTPNGVGNWFHKNCIEAQEKVNNFYITELPWDVHPDRDQEWFNSETRNMSRRQVAQELLCSFNMSGETVIDGEDLNHYEDLTTEPRYKTGFDRNYHIWEEFNPENTYVLTADVARGDGNDYSAFHVFDVTNVVQVAEYKGKADLDQFASIIDSAGKEYGSCMVVVENNNIGFAALQKLIEMEYPNLFWSTKGSNDYVEPYMAETMSNAVPGFTTSHKSRPLLIAKMEEYVRNKSVTLNSSRLINEMKTFIWNNGRPEAMKSYNDDLIMSFAIACWVRETTLITNQRAIEYNKAFLGAISRSSRYINTSISGMIGYEKSQAKRDAVERSKRAYKANEDFFYIYKG